MKKLFFLLLLVNTIFLLWEISPVSKPRLDSTTTGIDLQSQGASRIQLVGEIPVSSGNEVAENTADNSKTEDQPLAMDTEISATQALISDEVAESVADIISSAASEMLEQQISEHLVQLDPRSRMAAVEWQINGNSPSNAEQPVQPRRACYRLGPRFSRAQLAPLSNTVASRGMVTKITTEMADKATSFMVYYPAAETHELSRQNLDSLKSQGISDLWLINNGDRRGAISLGIFDRRERALILQNQMKEKGVQTRIQPSYSKRRGYFLVFSWIDDQVSLENIALTAGFKLDQLESIESNECP